MLRVFLEQPTNIEASESLKTLVYGSFPASLGFLTFFLRVPCQFVVKFTPKTYSNHQNHDSVALILGRSRDLASKVLPTLHGVIRSYSYGYLVYNPSY